MILLNGFLERDRLATIISRCVVSGYDDPESVRADTRELKRIVNLNAYTGCLILDAFAYSLFAALHGQPVISTPVQRKGDLKDFIIHRRSHVSPRVAAMMDRYQRCPEEYYRETPFNGRIYHHGENDAEFYGWARVKRFRRIAEKTSRYLIDFLFDAVKAKADSLAVERAARIGIEKNQLHTPLNEQVAEFARAEGRVLKAIRTGEFPSMLPTLPINDILGVKVVGNQHEIERVIEYLETGASCAVFEREDHHGNYNAINLLVRFRWPRDMVLECPPALRPRDILLERGLSCDIKSAFREFVSNAEDEVVVEVSLTSYDDMIESEFGRSMHENRILAQRQSQQYQGALARNIEYLMEYLFRFCVSPVDALDEVPIRLWGRYLPDYIEELFQRLSGVSAETSFTQACLCGGEASRREARF